MFSFDQLDLRSSRYGEHPFARNGNGHGDVKRPRRPLRRWWPLRVFGGRERGMDPHNARWTELRWSWQIASEAHRLRDWRWKHLSLISSRLDKRDSRGGIRSLSITTIVSQSSKTRTACDAIYDHLIKIYTKSFLRLTKHESVNFLSFLIEKILMELVFKRRSSMNFTYFFIELPNIVYRNFCLYWIPIKIYVYLKHFC